MIIHENLVAIYEIIYFYGVHNHVQESSSLNEEPAKSIPHPILQRPILIPSFHLSINVPSSVFSEVLKTKILKALLLLQAYYMPHPSHSPRFLSVVASGDVQIMKFITVLFL